MPYTRLPSKTLPVHFNLEVTSPRPVDLNSSYLHSRFTDQSGFVLNARRATGEMIYIIAVTWRFDIERSSVQGRAAFALTRDHLGQKKTKIEKEKPAFGIICWPSRGGDERRC